MSNIEDEDAEIDEALDAEEDESDEERCRVCGEYESCCMCDQPEDEDLVTSDYATFFRFGMGKVAFVVPRDEDWQPHARAYMEKTQYWPNLWEEEERGGYINITLEGP